MYRKTEDQNLTIELPVLVARAPEPPMWAVAMLVAACTLAVMGFLGCSPASVPMPATPEQVSCYGLALDKADDRARLGCHNLWQDCPNRDVILAQLSIDLLTCDAQGAQ